MKRKYEITIEYDSETIEEAIEYIEKVLTVNEIRGKIEIKHIQETRTKLQNRALHKYYSLLAEALNEAGMEMKKVIKEDVDIPWTGTTVKEILWRPLQKAYKLEHSTTKLKTGDIDKIYDILNKVIGERTGIYIAFPSIDNLRDEDN